MRMPARRQMRVQRVRHAARKERQRCHFRQRVDASMPDACALPRAFSNNAEHATASARVGYVTFRFRRRHATPTRQMA